MHCAIYKEQIHEIRPSYWHISNLSVWQTYNILHSFAANCSLIQCFWELWPSADGQWPISILYRGHTRSHLLLCWTQVVAQCTLYNIWIEMTGHLLQRWEEDDWDCNDNNDGRNNGHKIQKPITHPIWQHVCEGLGSLFLVPANWWPRQICVPASTSLLLHSCTQKM